MKRLFYLTTLLLLISCAHYKDVRPGADGVHHVVVHAADADAAERKAIKEANNYCEKEHDHSKAAFVKEEKTKYHGSMDEDTRNTLRNAGTAAMVAGAVMTPGHYNMLGAAGTGAYIFANGNDYTADMRFRCSAPGAR